MTIRVIIVDDHMIVRSGLEQFLATIGDIELVATASNGVEALERVEEFAPGRRADGPVHARDERHRRRPARSLERYPASRVLVLTSFSDQGRILDALEAGADGYLLKHADPDEIADAIQGRARRRRTVGSESLRACLVRSLGEAVGS